MPEWIVPTRNGSLYKDFTMLRCSHCGATQVRYAPIRWFDVIFLGELLRPCHCSSCHRQFFCFLWQRPEKR
jgi:hypothetical protein